MNTIIDFMWKAIITLFASLIFLFAASCSYVIYEKHENKVKLVCDDRYKLGYNSYCKIDGEKNENN